MHGLNSKSRTEIPIKDKASVHNKLKNAIYHNNETVRREKIKTNAVSDFQPAAVIF